MTDILAHHPLLQRSSHLRQSLDPAAVLPRLPDEEDAPRLLGAALRARFVRDMGSRERVSELHPGVEILDARDAGLLPEHEGAVVLERQHAHRDRSGDSDPAHSGAEHAGPAEEAEDCVDGDFCAGWVVSPPVASCSHDTSFSHMCNNNSVGITSIIRLASLKVIADSSDPTCKSSTELSYNITSNLILCCADDNVGAATWSSIECNTGIICACLPTLRPLISRILPRFLSTLSSGSRRLDYDETNRTTPTYRNDTQQPSSTMRTPGDDDEEDEYNRMMGQAMMEPLMPPMPRIAPDGTIEFPKPVHLEAEKKLSELEEIQEEIQQEKRGSSR